MFGGGGGEGEAESFGFGSGVQLRRVRVGGDAGEPLDFILKNTTFIWANSERTNKNLPPRRVWSFRAFIVEAFMKKTRRHQSNDCPYGRK